MASVYKGKSFVCFKGKKSTLKALPERLQSQTNLIVEKVNGVGVQLQTERLQE